MTELLRHANADHFRIARENRDAMLVNLGVSISEFKAYQRQAEVDNECGTDEYGETQPYKGLAMLSEFFQDFPTDDGAALSMMRRMIAWLTAIVDENYERYAGADSLIDCLTFLYDLRWEQGYYSLYQGDPNDLTDLAQVVSYMKEDQA